MSRSHDGTPGLHDLSFWHVAKADPFSTYPVLHWNVTLRPGRGVPPVPKTCPLSSAGRGQIPNGTMKIFTNIETGKIQGID